MHRVYVAWDADDARRFVTLLEARGIKGRIIEDRNFPARGELHDAEESPEVWISDEAHVAEAMELASELEARRRERTKGDGEAEADAG